MKSKIKSFAEKVREKQTLDNTGLGGEAEDAFTNVAARMGYGTNSLAEATEYELVRWTNNYWLMITLFRNHWISRRIVEKPAQDMTKAWPVLQSEHLDTGQIQDFDRLINRTYTPARIRQAIMWARLFGGAGALMVIDGHEGMLDKPLKLDDVNPGSYKGLITFDRWSGITPSAEIADDINSPVDFNLPLFYRVQGENQDAFDIHHSRILRFIGPDVPRPENQAQMHWGISELEVAYEEIRKRDNASWSILSLMFRAQILAQKNPALAQMLSGIGASGAAAKKFQQVMQAQNELMSNQSMLLMGADSDLQGHAYTFGGIAEVYQQFQMDIAGAAKIPVSILFGRTATGLGQSNDSDIRIYEQEIAQKQTDELRPQLDKLYPVICMSEFGEVPDDLDMNFPSIRVLTDEQKTENAGKVTEAVLAPYNAGVTSAKLTLQELKSQSDATDIFTNITDEMIEDADDQPVLPMEVEQGEARAGEEFEEEGDKPEPKGNKGAGKDERLYDEVTIQGLPIVVETKQGEIRTGKDFEVAMPADYGFIKGTIGADGDEVDCYVGPNIHSKMVYVVNQKKLGSETFDEHKCMLGFDSVEQALMAYAEGHHRSDEAFMSCKEMNMTTFKLWLRASAHTEPVQ